MTRRGLRFLQLSPVRTVKPKPAKTSAHLMAESAQGIDLASVAIDCQYRIKSSPNAV